MTSLLKRLRAPTIFAAILAVNGFVNLVTGLEPLFKLTAYLHVEDVPEILRLSAGQKVSGLLSVFFGLLMIAIGKGLYDRRRRSWYLAIGVLALMVANNAWRGTTPETLLLSVGLIVGLLVYRKRFRVVADTQLDYAQIAALASVVFAMGYAIGGVYIMRAEFGGVETWVDALYFTFVTFSTVGYGDILPQTDNAKIFTLSMILVGLASFATALTVLLGPLLERQMKGVLSLMTRFQRLTNHVVVCGYSNVSESIIHELRDRNVSYLVVDDRPDLIRHLQSKGHDVLQGDPSLKETLLQANLQEAAAIIAAFDSDSANTLIAVTAKAFREETEGARFRIVARVEEEENIEKVQRIGIEEVISPSTMGGRLIARRALESD